MGNGYVGHAVAVGFSSMTDVKVWDVEPKLADDPLDEVAQQDIIFICVPTPTTPDGVHKIVDVNEAIGKVLRRRRGEPPIFVIKSTVLPGTCSLFAMSYNVPVISNPEFLSAQTAIPDFLNPTSIVLGGEDIIALNAVYGLYRERFPKAAILLYEDAETAEMIKYVRNGFYVAKLAFLNEIAALCRQVGFNYDDVKEGLLASGWINPMHCDVPGHDGRMGFGGACLPKDGRALVGFGCLMGVPQTVLQTALESNEKIRGSK
jgi:UDPglucose 6-dehydrogenase